MGIFLNSNTELIVEANKLFDFMPKIAYGGEMPYDKVRDFNAELKRLFAKNGNPLSFKVEEEFFRQMRIMLSANNVEGARKLFNLGMESSYLRPWVKYTVFWGLFAGIVAMFVM